MSELIRTFIAIEIENKDVLARLISTRDQIVATGADLKPVEDENIHITLRFIGEIPAGMVRFLCNDMLNLKYPEFRIRVKGIGVFPNISRPRVIWAGVSEGFDKLVELHKQIELIVRRHGIPPEREEYIPHITIARVKGGRNIDKLIKILTTLTNADFGYTDVKEIKLKKSVLTPSGPHYSDLCGVRLA